MTDRTNIPERIIKCQLKTKHLLKARLGKLQRYSETLNVSAFFWLILTRNDYRYYPGFTGNSLEKQILSRIDYKHAMTAYCKSGIITNLVNHHGMKISELPEFNIASGIFFGYMKTLI